MKDVFVHGDLLDRFAHREQVIRVDDARRAVDAGAVAIADSWRALADVLLLSTVTGGGAPVR